MDDIRCPSCGGNRVLPIYRGYLTFDLARAVEEKRAVYDGPIVSDEGGDSWLCLDCMNRWR